MTDSDPQVSYAQSWKLSYFKPGKPLTEQQARQQHADGDTYWALLGDPQRPGVVLQVTLSVRVVNVYFLDHLLRKVYTQVFAPASGVPELFLEQIAVFQFQGEEKDQPRDAVTLAMSPDAGAYSSRQLAGGPVEAAQYAFDPALVELLAEPTPQFGSYASIARWDRQLPPTDPASQWRPELMADPQPAPFIAALLAPAADRYGPKHLLWGDERTGTPAPGNSPAPLPRPTVTYRGVWDDDGHFGPEIAESTARERHDRGEPYLAVLGPPDEPKVAVRVDTATPRTDVLFYDADGLLLLSELFTARPDGDGLFLHQLLESTVRAGTDEVVQQDVTVFQPDGSSIKTTSTLHADGADDEVTARRDPDPELLAVLHEPAFAFGDYISVARWQRDLPATNPASQFDPTAT